MLKTEYWFTLNDGLIHGERYQIIGTNRRDASSKFNLLSFINQCYNPYAGRISQSLQTLLMDLGIFSDETKYLFYEQSTGLVYHPTNFSRFINLLCNRYRNDYIVYQDHKETIFTPGNIDWLDANWRNWADKFLSILQYTYPKYMTLLDIYDNNISKLMDKLKTTHAVARNTARHENYDTDVSGKNLYNDAPQTTDVIATIEGNQYVSDISKSEAHTDNVGDISEAVQDTGTTETDSMTIMGKIKEIQDEYQMTLKKWTDEFTGLFIEEV